MICHILAESSRLELFSACPDDTPGQGGSVGTGLDTSRRRAGQKILFVDDNTPFAENMAELAEGAGYEATIVGSAEAAIHRVGNGDIFGIVTDFRLPGLDGIDMIEGLRRSGCAAPVAVLTAHVDDQLVERAARMGVRQILAKPIQALQLIRLVVEFDEDA